MRWDAIAGGLVLGFVADRLLGDPSRLHPVAGFGQSAARLEKVLWTPQRSRGALAVAAAVAPPMTLGVVAQRLPPPWRTVAMAGATWAALGGSSLEREGRALHALLRADDIQGARVRITHLVGRDPRNLDPDEIARACVESLAENSADAVVAPLLWGAVAGIPGVLSYRAVNTLDAMWGHRSDRYREFGWAAARLDDIANWLPARLTVALAAALAGRRAPDVIRIVRRDAPRHPSPNAGPVEAAWAQALGIRLGGTNTYGTQVEHRGTLGDGRPVRAEDIPRATAMLGRLSWAGLGVVILGRLVLRRR